VGFIIVSMLLIVVVAGLVVTFVAFPHRGEAVPGAPWLGETMNRAADALPTIADGELDPTGEHAAEPPGSHGTTDSGPKHV
jgi:hypothetical protein